MESNYWVRMLNRRVNRRRALLGAGGIIASSAFLAACGGDDEPSSTTGSTSTGTSAATGGSPTGATSASSTVGTTSSLLTEITDSTGQAVPGGRFVWAALQEPTHFDGVMGGGNPSQNIHQGLVYEALVRNKPGIGEPSTWSEVLPHLAEDWEVSPDKMTITFHLRPGVVFHNKAPVDSRPLDAEDVVTTWQNFEALSANAGAYSNNVNPSAPIVNIEAANASTVVFTLAMPHASILQRVANTLANAFAAVYPKEYGDGFDARHEMIGTGPYVLDTFTPSVTALYKRNPDYWDAEAAFFDEIEMPLLPEYATRLAQLTSGAVSAFQVSPLDVVPTKKSFPDLAMYSITEANSNPVWTIRFGWLPAGGGPSPFLDVRARQAISMSLDRELYIDTFGNVSNYQAEGLPVNTYWHTSMGYLPEITLDPRNPGTFGENAKYYEYNLEEANKLMSAAKSAYPGGDFPELNFYTSPGSQVAQYAETAEVLHQAMQEIGYRFTLSPMEGTEFNQQIGRTNGQYTGLAYHGGVAASRTAIDYFIWRFYSHDGGTGFLGIGGQDGNLGDMSGDAEVDALIEKLQGEYEPDASRDIMHELQRHLAYQSYCVPRPGFADSFALAWPAIRNFATFQGDTRVSAPGIYGWPQYWYDPSLPHGA